eukprot:TRINITY_DN96115_c0_g1_i1.p1 TRINITY_DN96115_c0_g1~~TRINITY_DN96115_c0_g1_i1.p1  ORF type:complete len:302 (+),score=51.16 TRINITY_DN96115_c0_g1_i1:39-908(+)
MTGIISSLQALFSPCKVNDSACSQCKDHEEEVLTAAIIERLERVKSDVLPPKSPDMVQAPHATASKEDGDNSGTSRSHESPGRSSTPTREGGSVMASAAAQRPGSRTLQVPPEFEGARQQVLEAASGQSSPSSAKSSRADHQRCLQACVRTFTKSLLGGVSVCVLLDDNRTRLAEARLDSDITHLVLHVPHAQHPVALKYIEGVCTPSDFAASHVHAGRHGEPLRFDCRATLTIRGGQFLTFVFDNPKVRDYFEMCIKVLVLAKGGGIQEAEQESQPTPAAGVGDVSSC